VKLPATKLAGLPRDQRPAVSLRGWQESECSVDISTCSVSVGNSTPLVYRVTRSNGELREYGIIAKIKSKSRSSGTLSNVNITYLLMAGPAKLPAFSFPAGPPR
jgi:hypothetical protein